MTKWNLPEGRKPLTDADIAALTRRLAGTAVDYKELYQAAKRDAEEAEAYAAELEAKLAKAVDALELADAALSGANMNMRVVEQRVKAALKELKGEKDE
jgi:hypothetical protein